MFSVCQHMSTVLCLKSLAGNHWVACWLSTSTVLLPEHEFPSTHSFKLWQKVPLPVKPVEQEQLKLPLVFEHSAFSWQLWDPIVHSSTSTQSEPSALYPFLQEQSSIPELRDVDFLCRNKLQVLFCYKKTLRTWRIAWGSFTIHEDFFV